MVRRAALLDHERGAEIGHNLRSYFGFLSPSFKMPFEEIKARIELSHGFNVSSPAPIEVKPPQRLRCPRCGATLSYRCTVLPRAPVSARIQSLVTRTLSTTTMPALDSGP